MLTIKVELFDSDGRRLWRKTLAFPQELRTIGLLNVMLDSLETRDIVAAYEGRAAARRAVREVLFVPDSLPPI